MSRVVRGRGGLQDVTNAATSHVGLAGKASTAAAAARNKGKDVKATSMHIGLTGRVNANTVAVQPLELADQHVERDPKYVVEYVANIYQGFMRAESAFAPAPSYMSNQNDITPRMRAILVDWLVEVHQKFKLLPQTLYISVNLLDRFLERVVVVRDELQLIGCCALWMASKFEEIYAPDPQDFVLISDHAFKRADLLAMEGKILNVLEFRLTAPTHYIFLTRWTFIGNADKRQRLLALYCMERTLQEYTFLKYRPSLIAASALYVSLEATASPAGRIGLWTSSLERSTNYSLSQLQECITEMRDLIISAEHRSLLAVRKKYLTEENALVAKIPLVPNAPGTTNAGTASTVTTNVPTTTTTDIGTTV